MKKRLLLAVISLVVLLTATLVFSATASDSLLVAGSHLTIDGEYVLGIPMGVTGAELKANFSSTVTGIEDEEIVVTGSEITVGGTTLYPVIIGDVNGDNAITTTDYISVKRAIYGTKTLEGAYGKAADLSGEGELSSADYLKIKRAFGGADLYGNMNIVPDVVATETPVVTDAPSVTLNITNKGTGGNAYQEGNLLKVSVNSGYRIKSITADGVKIYLTDGTYSASKLAGKAVVATFEAVTSANATNSVPTSVTNTFYDKDASVFGINWRSTGSAQPVLKYIEAGNVEAANADFTNAKVVTGYTEVMSGCYKNTATMEDLTVGTKYYYIVGDSNTNVWSDVCSITPKNPDDGKVTFFHMSDSQDATNMGLFWAYDLKLAFENYPDADFVVNTGDIVQQGGVESEWTTTFNHTAPYLNNSVLVGVAGNHDYWDDLMFGNTACTYAHFNMTLPNNQDAARGMYYSFDYGEDIHFVVLSTGDTVLTSDGKLTKTQVDWLKADLAASDAKWKIVAMHNPLYSPGKYGSGANNAVALALCEQLNPVFAQYGVDLVLNGHDHVYSVTYPIDSTGTAIKDYTTETIDGIPYMINPGGTVHLESGTAGEQYRALVSNTVTVATNLYKKATASGKVYYSAITIEGDTLTVRYHTVNATGAYAGIKQSTTHKWGIIKR